VTTVYRTILKTSSTTPVDDAVSLYSNWLKEKQQQGTVPESIVVPSEAGAIQDGPFEIRRVDAADEVVSAVRISLSQEDTPGERWSTEMTAWANGDGQWIWIDLSRTTDDPFLAPLRYSVPRLVRHTLDRLDCTAGSCELTTRPWEVASRDAGVELAELVLDRDRPVPLVVVTMPRFDGERDARRYADELQRRLTGIALIALVHPGGQTAFESRIGNDLKVFGGALRVYLPNATPAKAYRHRYYAAHRLASFDRSAWDRLARPLVQQATAARPPASYRDHVHALLRATGNQASAEELLEDLIRVEAERDMWKRQSGGDKVTARAALDERDELLKMVDRLERRMAYLESGQGDHGDAAEAAQECPVPLTFAELLERFEGEGLVSLGDQAWDGALDLDSYGDRAEWVAKTWVVLNDLKRYAIASAGGGDESFDGGYAQWLGRGNPGVDFVFNEGSQTKKDKVFRRIRTFPVPAEVNDAGEVVMWAHVRIGGNQAPAPRLHLHDDTGGSTGVVYVGYIGEHLETAGSRRI
jgi:hypothetical protein